jgi:uncharacterized protein YjbI with pentapeptide repeats
VNTGGFGGVKTPCVWHFYGLLFPSLFDKFGFKHKDMENNNDLIQLSETKKILKVKRAMIDGSSFNDISAKNMKIVNANLSDLEIEGAQIGGAFIHNIGMPPKGHPMYDPDARQRPIRFENCDLRNSTLTNCNLENLVIDDCNLKGLKINGILLEDLLKTFSKQP